MCEQGQEGNRFYFTFFFFLFSKCCVPFAIIKKLSLLTHQETTEGACLVAQWLRTCLPMQGHGFKPWSGRIPCAAERLGP